MTIESNGQCGGKGIIPAHQRYFRYRFKTFCAIPILNRQFLRQLENSDVKLSLSSTIFDKCPSSVIGELYLPAISQSFSRRASRKRFLFVSDAFLEYVFDLPREPNIDIVKNSFLRNFSSSVSISLFPFGHNARLHREPRAIRWKPWLGLFIQVEKSCLCEMR